MGARITNFRAYSSLFECSIKYCIMPELPDQFSPREVACFPGHGIRLMYELGPAHEGTSPIFLRGRILCNTVTGFLFAV